MRLLLSSIFVLVLSLLPVQQGIGKTNSLPTFSLKRNQLITFILKEQLPQQHFSRHPVNDDLSETAFALYLRNLDPRKRFLTQDDVQQLQAHATTIDNELMEGNLDLVDMGAHLLRQRIVEVQDFIDPLLNAGFSYTKKAYLESDPQKVRFSKNGQELQVLWKKLLQRQVLDTYLNALEEQESAEKTGEATGKKAKKEQFQMPAYLSMTAPDKAGLQKAIEKVRTRSHRALKRLLQETRQEYYDRYFNVITRAFDPHTTYMAPTSKEDFDIHMTGSLEGIGALLREEDGEIKVLRILPGSAAKRQGQLQAEDTILAVAEKNGPFTDIVDMRIRDAVRYIRGPKGTEVRLNVSKPDGRKLVIPIVRDVVQVEEAYVKSQVLETEHNERIGYIRIPSFYRDFSGGKGGQQPRNVTDDTKKALEQVTKKHIQGLILDLRNNGGGALTDAVDISGLFITKGPVVQVRNSANATRVLADEDPTIMYDGPLIVLVNQFSASASEILAAALQDHGRALIIGGKHTHGKGTVQTLVNLNRLLPFFYRSQYDDLGTLKLTIQKFYRINGGSTQFKGVEPDIVVPTMLDHLKSGEQYQDNALPWDHVLPLKSSTQPNDHLIDVSALKKKAQQWVAGNDTFEIIRKQSAKAAKRAETTEVPVYFQGMLEERRQVAEMRIEIEKLGLDDQITDREKDRDGLSEEEQLSLELDHDPTVQLSVFLMQGE